MSAKRTTGHRAVALDTVDDPVCRRLLDTYERAGVGVSVWDLTTDVGAARLRGDDRRPRRSLPRRLPAAMGVGCHPDRAVALSRALTEAAQSRLTVIAGSRDDCPPAYYRRIRDPGAIATQLAPLGDPAERSFADAPHVPGESIDEDVAHELDRAEGDRGPAGDPRRPDAPGRRHSRGADGRPGPRGLGRQGRPHRAGTSGGGLFGSIREAGRRLPRADALPRRGPGGARRGVPPARRPRRRSPRRAPPPARDRARGRRLRDRARGLAQGDPVRALRGHPRLRRGEHGRAPSGRARPVRHAGRRHGLQRLRRRHARGRRRGGGRPGGRASTGSERSPTRWSTSGRRSPRRSRTASSRHPPPRRSRRGSRRRSIHGAGSSAALDRDDEEHERLRAWLPRGWVLRKRADALELLRIVGDDLLAGLEPFRPGWTLNERGSGRRRGARSSAQRPDGRSRFRFAPPTTSSRRCSTSPASSPTGTARCSSDRCSRRWRSTPQLPKESTPRPGPSRLLSTGSGCAAVSSSPGHHRLARGTRPEPRRRRGPRPRLAALRWARQAHLDAVSGELPLALRTDDAYTELAQRAARKRAMLSSLPRAATSPRTTDPLLVLPHATATGGSARTRDLGLCPRLEPAVRPRADAAGRWLFESLRHTASAERKGPSGRVSVGGRQVG